MSDKTTHICMVYVDGKILRHDVVASDPGVLAKWLNRQCPDIVRVVLETGTLSTFLYHGVIERHVAAGCICARHPKGGLSVRVNKSDVHDAEGLAQLGRTGWYKRDRIKASATHIDRAAVRIRARPPDFEALFAVLTAAMDAIEEQLRTSNRLLNDRAKAYMVCTRLMAVPGVGPITALTYASTIEDPRRFAKSEDVEAHAGLVPRRSMRIGRGFEHLPDGTLGRRCNLAHRPCARRVEPVKMNDSAVAAIADMDRCQQSLR